MASRSKGRGWAQENKGMPLKLRKLEEQWKVTDPRRSDDAVLGLPWGGTTSLTLSFNNFKEKKAL
jgi:hypothetical protein